MLFSYWLDIWTYQVYMNQIPRFQFCNILRLQISLNSISIFEFLISLARLSEQLRLSDKALPITYLWDFFCKSTTTILVEIKIVPIYHTYAQTLRHIYFSIVSDYLDVVDSLHGVTGYLMRNVCTNFGILFLVSFCCYLFEIKIFSGKQSLEFSILPSVTRPCQ